MGDGFGLGILALALTFILMAIAAWIWGQYLRQRSGLPAGKVIYTDTNAWYKQDNPLYDEELMLVGRPDYLVQESDGQIIPVEVKSSQAPAQPYEGHVLQLAAYCLLVEAEFGVRPSHGILQYKDKAFAIDFTPELEDDVLELIEMMRQDLYEEDIPRDHDEPQRCRRCGVRGYCDQWLD